MLPTPPSACVGVDVDVGVGVSVDAGGRDGVLVLLIAGAVERPSPTLPPMAP
jgi:hypothetical protein